MAKINGGATLWARQTLDSKIFCDKPHVWFKIWFYLVNKANHKDNRRYKRGSNFMKYDWIMQKTRAKKSELDHAMRWFRFGKMIATRKAIGGFVYDILKYNGFQSLENYKSDTKSDGKSDTKAIQKRYKSDTLYKNDKNDKYLREESNNKIQITKNKEPKKKAPANNIEFDFELWSWHGIDDDIKDRWAKIFPHIEVEIELNKIRVFLKGHPKHEQVIKDKFNNNYAIYIFDWLTRAEGYYLDDHPDLNITKKGND